MGSIGGYIFRTAFGAFLLVFVSLTGVIWLTQALREFDIITSQGQTLMVFLGITALAIPLLTLVIAPIALLIAIAYTLNKLATDSELIVMNAAGMNPRRIFWPLFVLTVIVAAVVAFISAYFAAASLRMARDWIAEVHADLVSQVVQPGRFMSLQRGLTFHIRERRANGQLLGIVVDDRRDEKERNLIIAEQGEIVKNETGKFLLLENGSIQRQEAKNPDPRIVMFDKYAFEVARFSASPTASNFIPVRERTLWELYSPPADDPVFKLLPARFRIEFHDRIMSALYPFAFLVIAFAFLGAPRTTRQSRTWSMLSVVGLVALVRMTGFASTVLGARFPAMLAVPYIVVLLTLVLGGIAIARGVVIEPPAFLIRLTERVTEYLARRTGAVPAGAAQ